MPSTPAPSSASSKPFSPRAKQGILATRSRPHSQARHKEEPIATPTFLPPPLPTPIDPANITTAFDLPGYTLVRNLGLVRGLTVRSRNAFGTLGARFQTLLGGNISLFTELGERTRQDAFALMAQHAAELGANAIIGVRYDANEIMQGVTEILAYGTAVVVAPSPTAISPKPPPPAP